MDDTTVQKILARAVQLDEAKSDHLRIDQVRSIASDLGLSPAAVEQALAEYGVAPKPAAIDAQTRQRRRWMVAVAILVVVGIIAIVFGRTVPAPPPPP